MLLVLLHGLSEAGLWCNRQAAVSKSRWILDGGIVMRKTCGHIESSRDLLAGYTPRTTPDYLETQATGYRYRIVAHLLRRRRQVCWR